MRYLGIDFGTKRVGLALSDETNAFALPLKVLDNSNSKNKDLYEEINSIVCDKEITTIILGESKNYKGEDNIVMKKVREFKEGLENRVGKPVVFEPEFMTSHHAARVQGDHDMLDASSAALILQSYLDRSNQTPPPA